MIDLIEGWHCNRMYYVSVDGSNFEIYDVLLGTVQGSILGPVLYAMFISPLFEIESLFAFADNKFVPKVGYNKWKLVKDMETTLEAIRKWMQQSELEINENETKICLFYKCDTDAVTAKYGMDEITPTKSINILEVTFDFRLYWSQHIREAIVKSTRSFW